MNEAITPTVVNASAHSPEATSLATRGDAFLEITTPETYKAAGEWLVTARSFVKKVWSLFDPVLDAQYQAWKKGRAHVTEIVTPVEAKSEAVALALKAFERRAEEARLAEERRIREEREAREKEEREVLALMAEEADDPVAAEQIREAPSALPPVHVARSAYVPAVQGLSSRKSWKSKITDLRKLAAAVAEGHVGTDCLIGIGKHAKYKHLRSSGTDGLAKSMSKLLNEKDWGLEAYEDDVTVTSGDD